MRDVLVYIDSGTRHSEARWKIDMEYVDLIEDLGAARTSAVIFDDLRRKRLVCKSYLGMQGLAWKSCR